MTVPRISSPRFLTASLVGLALLFTLVGGVQTGMAQIPTLDEDEPISTLEDALRTAESDSQLVTLATALLDAREETEISHSTFRKGVWRFRQLRPDFYGNFFGDPFLATYDIDYMRMDRLRDLAVREVDPFGGLAGLFACDPLSYDPAFRICRGFKFAASDFFFLPSGPSGPFFAPLNSYLAGALSEPRGFATLQSSATRDHSWNREHTSSVNNVSHERSPAADTSSRSRPSVEEGGDEIAIDDVSGELDPEIKIPDLSSRLKSKAASLQEKEIKARLQYHIEQEFGGRQNLTNRERARLASEVANTLQSSAQSDGAVPTASRIRDRLREDVSEVSEFNRSDLPDRAHPTSGTESGHSRSSNSGDASNGERSSAETRDVSTSDRERSSTGTSEESGEN